MMQMALQDPQTQFQDTPAFAGPKTVMILLIVLYIVTFGMLAMRQHLAFETGAFDLGNYDQAMWNAAHGRGLTLTTMPTLAFNRMGLHVEPILFLLVPLYWIWSSPLTLVWVQTIALGLAAWPLFLLARRALQADWSAVLIALTYLLLPATQSVNLFDFHAVALSPLFMLIALYLLDRALRESGLPHGFWWRRGATEAEYPSTLRSRHLIWAALAFTLAMATKEDVSLHVLMVGLYLMLFLRRWRLGLILAAYGLAWAIIAFGWVIPAYRIAGEQSAYVKYFPGLGETPLEIALSPLTKPRLVWDLVVTPENIAALRMITLPFAFLGLIGWPVFILAAPSLAISFLSNNPLQKELETWHYAAPMLPFITLAAVDGLARIKTWLQRRGYSEIRVWTVCLMILLLVAGGYHYLRGYSPLSKPFRWPEITAHQRLGWEIAADIPEAAAVVALADLVPHLSQRQQVSLWAGRLPQHADYVFMDVSHPSFLNQDDAHDRFISTMVFEKDMGLTLTKDGYLILQKGAERLPTQVGFQDFLFAGPTWRDQPSQAQFGDLFSLVGIETHTKREAEPQVTLYFHVLQQPQIDYFFRLYLLNEAGEPVGETVFQQPVLVWWPTTLWQPGDVIKIRFNTLPWWTGDGKQNRFSYAVAVSDSEERWDVAARLPVSGQRALPENLAFVHDFQRLAGMAYPVPEAGR